MKKLTIQDEINEAYFNREMEKRAKCKHEIKSWDRNIGSWICDDCNERVI